MKHIFSVASVYFLAARWPYIVITNYTIDGNISVLADMQDHSAPVTQTAGDATISSGVVASWIGTANQEHTILATIPSGIPGGGNFGVVDMFM